MVRTTGLDSFAAGVLLLAVGCVALAWTPSSYGALLDTLGASGEGLVVGEPREIRSDEWAVWTPYIQATVNNDFQRINETSIYREDLRNFNGLPLLDWALFFKPYFWPFFIVDAAHAFSFYHVSFIALFLIGYQRLLVSLELQRSEAIFGCLTLFFCAFVQTWWTTWGPLMALFPWLVLAVMAETRPWVKAITLAYAGTSWVLVHAYPPMIISLGFAGLVTLLAFRPSAFRPRSVVAVAVGLAVAGLLVVLYLEDALRIMASTIYPGQRISSGGEARVTKIQWAAQVFPFFVANGFRNLIGRNICEASTIGTWLPLFCLVFVDYRAVGRRLLDERRLRWQVGILAAGVVLTSAWILLPVPSMLGRLLLWHRVPAWRMWFGCGFPLVLLALHLMRISPLRLAAPRLAAAFVTVVGSWWLSHRLLGASLGETWTDLVVLAPLSAVFLLRHRLGGSLLAQLLACTALANAVSYGLFNPIQSAKPIFDRPETTATRMLDRLAQRHPKGWLVIEGYGAVLNGLGYASGVHVLMAPTIEFFRPRFPELDESRLQELFNRFMFLNLTPQTRFDLSDRSELAVPIDSYDPVTAEVVIDPLASGSYSAGGVLESQQLYRDGESVHLLIRGWVPRDGSNPEARFRLSVDRPVERVRAYANFRPKIARAKDDPGLALSGFTLRLEFEPSVLKLLRRPTVCIVSEDPDRGNFTPTPAACRLLSRGAP